MIQKKILIIENNDEFRDLIRPVFNDLHVILEETSSGQEANEKLKVFEPDLIIVDSDLPDIEGIEWIQKFRAENKSTEIVFVSANWGDLRSFEKLTNELGVALIINKPIVLETFSEQIKNQLHKLKTTQTNEKLESLRNAYVEVGIQYRKDLPAKIKELTESVHAVRKNIDDSNLLHQAKTLAHKIRGTAGTHGLEEITNFAAKIEDLLLDKNTFTSSWTQMEELLSKAAYEARLNVPREDADAKTDSVQAGGEKLTIATILVVDEDAEFLKHVTELGRMRLVNVITCQKLSEALEEANKHSLDGVIIDVELGGDFRAFRLANILRSLPDKESLPIAFISKSGHVYDRVVAAQTGASLYLSKPLDPAAFESAVNHMRSLNQTEKRRILIVDDDVEHCNRIITLFQQNRMDAFSLNDPIHVLESLQELNPDLLLLDMMMPGISGFDLCKIIRTIARWQDLPIIFLTAETGMKTRIAAYQSGADDYLSKPCHDDELVSRIKVRIERNLRTKERTEKDTLTGLWLKRSFMEQANAIVSLAKRQQFKLTLALIDLDHFKMINDTHGHLAGDSVLSVFGKLYLKNFRISDLRGRFGGDEFIGLFQTRSVEETQPVMEKFLSEFNSVEFTADNGTSFNCTLSIGLAEFPTHGENIYDLLKAADKGVYAAKKAGRNAVIGAGAPA